MVFTPVEPARAAGGPGTHPASGPAMVFTPVEPARPAGEPRTHPASPFWSAPEPAGLPAGREHPASVVVRAGARWIAGS